MKTAVLLSGSGVYDGSEIHEAVLTLLALSQNNLEYVCVAPDIKQFQVVNHLSGEVIDEERNVLIESARISRGDILSLSELKIKKISSLIIVGGFGAAKNLSNWAFEGTNCFILNEVKQLILDCIENKKPIVTLCVSPVLIAKSLEGSKYVPQLTLGSIKEKSEYNISEVHEAITKLGASANNKSIKEICFDKNLKIISAPCYMLDATIKDIYENIKIAIEKLSSIIE